MSDHGSVKWVTKIYIKYFMAHERAWKTSKFVLNLYTTQLLSPLRFKIRRILNPEFNLNVQSKCE
jgi:hypothetical protein